MSASDNPERHPILASALERNIRSMFAQRERVESSRSVQDRISDAITDFSGQMTFVYLHVGWFAVWIAWNLGSLSWLGAKPFDPFPFGLLTLIVSLEAIFLSTFVLISQNRIGESSERRANLHLQIGLLTEHEVTRALRMLDQIQEKLGCVPEDGTDLNELEAEVRPEDVLAEIEKMQHRVRRAAARTD
jgi:uncharacterized membrane protein